MRRGTRSEALLFAANGLVPKFTLGFGAFIGGALITYVKFPTHALQGTVDPAIVRHLAQLYLPCVAIFNGGSVLALSFYKLDRATQTRNLERLAETAALAEQAQVSTGTIPAPQQLS